MNISVKLPNDLRGKILSFPFLHALVKEARKLLSEEEILNLHLISSSENIDVLNLLPYSAYYHELDNDDLKSIFTIHRAISNIKVDKTDLFISTTESFIDATIGKNLKASISAGFSIGKNRLLLQKKISYNREDHQALQIFSLISSLDLDEMPSIPNVCSREVTPLYSDWNTNPYFVINLSLKSNEFHPEWIELINLFEQKNIILMCDGLKDYEQYDRLSEFTKKLTPKNHYKIFQYESNIDFAKLVSFSWCFISEDSPLIQLSAYCGAVCHYLNRIENQNKYGSQYFIGEVKIYKKHKEQNDFSFSTIFDDIYRFIESKAGEIEE